MDFLTKNKFMVTLIIVLVILNLLTLGTLWLQHSKRPPMHPQSHLPRFMGGAPNMEHQRNFLEQELNLTKEQTQKIETLREQFFKENQSIMSESFGFKKELIEEALKPTPDQGKIKQLTEKIGLKLAEMELSLFKHIEGTKAILNPEQFEKFKKLFSEMFQKNQFPPLTPFPGRRQGNFPGGPTGNSPMPPAGEPGQGPGTMPPPEPPDEL